MLIKENIYNYIIKNIYYINIKDPTIIKFIVSIPTINLIQNKKLNLIVNDYWILYLKNIKTRINSIDEKILNKIKKYEKEIIMSYIYGSEKDFCPIVNKLNITIL